LLVSKDWLEIYLYAIKVERICLQWKS